MKYNSKYDRFVDDDLVIYRYDKKADKLVQCSTFYNCDRYMTVYTKLGYRAVHGVLWETMIGAIPECMVIDHINTVRDDNRLENLRVVTPKENLNNPLTRKHRSEAMKGNIKARGKTRSEFGKKFKERYGLTAYENQTLYDREKQWFYKHGYKCRWEMSTDERD